MTAPIPIGVTASFAHVGVLVQTANFSFGEQAIATITFQPVDNNNPGTATLYDSAGNVIVSISTEGYETFQVPTGGGTYYFKATLGANILAATIPNFSGGR